MPYFKPSARSQASDRISEKLKLAREKYHHENSTATKTNPGIVFNKVQDSSTGQIRRFSAEINLKTLESQNGGESQIKNAERSYEFQLAPKDTIDEQV